jgi:hypothetical protein
MVLRFVVDVHTTCFGLHGHLQVCKIFYFLVLKEHGTKATKAAKQIPSGLKSKISYTPEDGHVRRNM